MKDDPDETEGRKLYRAHANKLARAQMSMAVRKVRLVEGRSSGAASPSAQPQRNTAAEKVDPT